MTSFREAVLSQRRVVYRVHGLKVEEAREWLLIAKACREARNFSVATDAVLHATALGAKAALVDHAKLLYFDNQVRCHMPSDHVGVTNVNLVDWF